MSKAEGGVLVFSLMSQQIYFSSFDLEIGLIMAASLGQQKAIVFTQLWRSDKSLSGMEREKDEGERAAGGSELCQEEEGRVCSLKVHRSVQGGH